MTETIQSLEQEHAAAVARAAQLAADIATEKANVRAAVLADIKADIASYGIKPVELFASAELFVPKAEIGALRRVAKAHKTPLAAKYRNPETGATWVGRGNRPGWLNAGLAAGKQLSDYAI